MDRVDGRPERHQHAKRVVVETHLKAEIGVIAPQGVRPLSGRNGDVGVGIWITDDGREGGTAFF